MSQSKEVDITALEMAFAKDPASAAFLSLSEAYLGQGRFMEAMVVCKKGIKSNPDALDGHVLLARIYLQQGKIPKALEEVESLLGANPKHVPCLIVKGQILDKKGDSDGAIAIYKQALDIDKDAQDATEALKKKGIDYAPVVEAPPPPVPVAPAPTAPAMSPVSTAATQQAGPTSRPVAQHAAAPVNVWQPPPRQATSYDGKPFDPNQGLEPIKKRGAGVTLGIVAAGVAVLGVFFLWFALHARELRKIDDLNSQALALVSKDTARTLGEAVDKLNEVLKLDSEQELALGLKAFAMAVRGFEHGIKDDRTALPEVLKKAQEKSNTSWRYAAEIMSTLYNGDATGAEAKAKELTEKGYATVQTFAALAQAAIANGNMTLAAEALKKAREAGPTSVRAQVQSAEYYRRLLQMSLARAQYDAAIKTSPDHAYALAGRAILALENPIAQTVYSAYQDWQTIQDVGRASIGPTVWGRAKTVDAYVARLRSKNEDAEQSLKDAQDPRNGDPGDADVLYMSARVMLLMGKRDEAIELLKKSAKVDPHRVSTHVVLARALTEAGKMEEADAALARARKLDSENVQIVVAEAVSKRNARKYDDAIGLLKKAAEENSGNVTVQLELLDTYQTAGKHPEVLKQFDVIEKAFGDVKSVMSRAAVMLGQSFLKQREVNKATEAFRSALELDGKNADGHFYLGFTLMADRKSSAEAYLEFQRYLEQAPEGEYAERAKKYAAQVK
ncbi:MAG: tetratricopeptide repeat protein [Pseudomonadota bacterium]